MNNNWSTDKWSDFFEGSNTLESISNEERYNEARENHDRFNPDRDESLYAPDWKKISYDKRCESNFECETCGIDLKERQDLLHVHHSDRNKLNNEFWNLKAVCALCHSEYEGHFHLYKKLRSEALNFIKDKQKHLRRA